MYDYYYFFYNKKFFVAYIMTTKFYFENSENHHLAVFWITAELFASCNQEVKSFRTNINHDSEILFRFLSRIFIISISQISTKSVLKYEKAVHMFFPDARIRMQSDAPKWNNLRTPLRSPQAFKLTGPAKHIMSLDRRFCSLCRGVVWLVLFIVRDCWSRVTSYGSGKKK